MTAFAGTVTSSAPSRSASLEIVKRHVDIQVNPDGSFISASEIATRALTASGAEALRQTSLSYTEGYESLQIVSAYTLKADGTHIDVPAGGILEGRGATSSPGFQDVKTLAVFFPSLEIGDQAVLVTLRKQKIPWFKNQFAMADAFDNAIAARDVRFDLSAPTSMSLAIDVAGMDGGKRATVNGNDHWTWSYHNDTPVPLEMNAVSPFDEGTHISVSSFRDFREVAKVYVEAFKDKAIVTPEIQTLANQLTSGIQERRAQANALYDWVSKHIAYVNIVLGAGGFTPHGAREILASRYGDCKDHVIILQALLAAKGITSTPVLIDTGDSYRRPIVGSPFLYDHLITYVPEMKLYLDSTARFAAFGALPPEDEDKPVLLIASGQLTRTPATSGIATTLNIVGTLTFDKDGSATGDTRVTAAGEAAFALRAWLGFFPPNRESDYFRAAIGPEADGSLSRGDDDSLSPSYSFEAHYHSPNMARFPGPGAISLNSVYRPTSLAGLIAPALPATRTRSYTCSSIAASDDLTIRLPDGAAPTFLPGAENIVEEGASLQTKFESLKPGVIHAVTTLRLTHPRAVCSPSYYNSVRQGLSKMLAALGTQIIYR